MTRYFSISFPEGLVREPIFYSLVKKYGLAASIRTARVDADAGWLLITIEGDQAATETALLDLKGRGAVVVEGGPELLEETEPPAHSSVKIRLSAPKEKMDQPVIAELINTFDLVINIRRASVGADGGMVELLLTGPLNIIDDAIESLRNNDIRVSPIEGNVIE